MKHDDRFESAGDPQGGMVPAAVYRHGAGAGGGVGTYFCYTATPYGIFAIRKPCPDSIFSEDFEYAIRWTPAEGSTPETQICGGGTPLGQKVCKSVCGSGTCDMNTREAITD